MIDHGQWQILPFEDMLSSRLKISLQTCILFRSLLALDELLIMYPIFQVN